MKKVFVVRHCEARGQEPEAVLTEKGLAQALELAEFFQEIPIDQIISSPFERAVASIRPLAERNQINSMTDNRLSERILSTEPLPDWLDKLELSFDDLHMKLPGGESSVEAMERIVDVVNDISMSSHSLSIIVTHGNIMSLLLKHINPAFGFKDWQKLSNPDIYVIKKEQGIFRYERIWQDSE